MIPCTLEVYEEPSPIPPEMACRLPPVLNLSQHLPV